jgi:serine/threonine protein kinase
MAPEMIKGDPYDEKVDVWSIGVILYMLVVHRHPISMLEQESSSRQSLKDKLVEKFKFIPREELVDMNAHELFG